MVAKLSNHHRVYLDEASDAPLLDEVKAELLRWTDAVGDPARPYAEGLEARRAIERARTEVAELLGIAPRNITFCSSATEGLNWLVYAAGLTGSALVVSKVEHSAVTNTARKLASELDLILVEVGVDSSGQVIPDSLEDAMAEAASKAYGGRPSRASIFCFIQHANHELGTLQPLPELVEVARRYGGRIISDAAQTAGRVPIDFKRLGVVALVVSAHKFGGPKGAAAVALAPGFRPRPLLYGAAQERGRRAGTEDVAALSAFGVACRSVTEDLEKEAQRQRRITEYLAQETIRALPGTRVLGHPTQRVPHIISLELSGVQGEAVVLALDKQGFAVHSGSACAAEAFEPSPILAAVGADSRRNLRISIGRSTEPRDIDNFVSALRVEVGRLQALSKDHGASS